MVNPLDPIGIQGPWRWLKRSARFRGALCRGHFQAGKCPVCESATVFVRLSENLREDQLCFRCLSKPRWRALIYTLQTQFPNWRELRLYEASPAGPASQKLQTECRHYIGGHFYPGVPGGQICDGFRSENLEALTFASQSLDLIVSQDVMEHIPHPEKAFAEIARVLAPGGAHVFTIPYFPDQPTVVRVRATESHFEFPLEKQFHGNPIDGAGSLVITDWGNDLCERIAKASGLTTEVYRQTNLSAALSGEFVIVSRLV